MEYELLSKIFYKKPTEYESIYDARFNSEASIKLPIKIHENVGFIFNTNEITKLLVKIYKTINKINLLRTHLPNIAINSYIIKSLKDEIALTNEIEGVRSTRKEIEDAIDSIKNDKSARFKGLVDKYFKLISNEIIPLNNCEDIRTIYDALVLPEIEKENLPDGILFRKEPVQVVSATQKEKHRGIMPESKIIESLDLCLDFLKSDDIDSLIKISAFHYLFGYIHPFYDLNNIILHFYNYVQNSFDIILPPRLHMLYIVLILLTYAISCVNIILYLSFCAVPSWESGPFIQKHMQFKFGKSCHYTAVLYGAIMALFLF